MLNIMLTNDVVLFVLPKINQFKITIDKPSMGSWGQYILVCFKMNYVKRDISRVCDKSWKSVTFCQIGIQSKYLTNHIYNQL